MKRFSAVLFSLVASTGIALAQDPPADGTTTTDGTGETAPADPATDPTATPPADPASGVPGVYPPLTQLKGKLALGGQTANINMSADAVAKPVSFAPSLWYGVSDTLTVGVTHDGGTTAWTPRSFPGSGICISGKEDGCGKVYDNISLDALYGLKNEKFSAAIHGAVDFESFDPATLSLRLGVLGRFMATEQVAIAFDPRIAIGLTERDGVESEGITIGGNKETIDVPVWVWFRPNAQLGVYGHIGINGPLDGFGDAYAVPVGFGASFAVNEKASIGADFTFLNLAGKGSSADFRSLGIRVGYQL